MAGTEVISAMPKGSQLCGISYSWKVSAEEPTEQRRNQSPGGTRNGGVGGGGERLGGWVDGGVGGGLWQQTGRERGEQGAEHKASQIDLSLHQESLARPQHYHTHHTLLDDRVPATY